MNKRETLTILNIILILILILVACCTFHASIDWTLRPQLTTTQPMND